MKRIDVEKVEDMALSAVIFDVDGTLVDTNHIHVECWQRAFECGGYSVPTSRIAPQIGKGGDMLVPAILGEDVEKKSGETLRKYWKQEFLQIAASEHFTLFPQVRQLLEALHQRDIKVAIATSGKKEILEAIEKSTGCELQKLVDIVVTADDAEQSKPAPDIVVSTLKKLNLPPNQCSLVGDTPYDMEACSKAGVAGWGVLSGGHKRETLEQAGARAVWQDTADLLAHLHSVLK